MALTRELAAVHARENIRFNSLCPGPIRTPLLMNFLDNEAKKQRRLVHVPMGRFGEAIEQAYAGTDRSNFQPSFSLRTNHLLSLVLTSLSMVVYPALMLHLKVQQLRTVFTRTTLVFDKYISMTYKFIENCTLFELTPRDFLVD